MQYSVVNYKTVKENSDFRIDAEYHHPEYLELEKELKNYSCSPISSFAFVTDGEHGAVELKEEGVRYLMAENVKDGYVDISNIRYVDESIHIKNKRASVKEGNILISIKGSLGQVAVVENWLLPANLSRDVAIIKVKDDSFLSEYVALYLQSQVGQKMSVRLGSGGVQQMITLGRLREILVPVLSRTFQVKIKNLYIKSQDLRLNSKSLYSQAEQLLLSELGLTDWKPKHTLSFVKNFLDTEESNRFDAEYFQPKYEEIIKVVKKYKGGFNELGNLVKIKDKNFTPKDNEQYKYIELANISSNGEINGYTKNFGNELPSRARRKVQKDDLIVSSIEGSLESIALITEDWKNALCSTGFFAVNSDKINSETLLVLLKTKVGQLQLKKGCKGTILTAISKDELSKIVLPKINSKTQEEVRKKITEMYKTKKLSKFLLEIAKRGVEIAIEKDEKEAKKWIDSEIKSLGIKL